MELSPASSAALELSSQGELGPFRLLRRLGRGASAPVYLAEEVHDGKTLREVALKLFFLPEELAPDSAEAAAFRDRVLAEARALCRVEHANVVRFHAVHRDDARGVLGLVMEHVPGESLHARLRASGPLSEPEVLAVGVEMAWALSAVHHAGLVHGDVKPANILKGPTGCKLIDFGIVADLQRGATPGLEHAGTPGYLAPERRYLGAPASPATDLFALGVTLYRLLHGKMPDARQAEGPTVRVGRRKTDSPAPDDKASEGKTPLSDLDKLTGQLLSPDPHARPRHAEWVARKLSAMQARLAGALPAKGDSAPDSAAAVLPLPARSSAGPASTRLSAAWLRDAVSERKPEPEAVLRMNPPLVGREAALATIDAAAARARTGALGIVLVRGPLGTGRSRILSALAERSGVSPGRALLATCSPERKSPFLPLLRALEALPRDAARALSAVEEALEEARAPETPLGPRQLQAAIESVEEALLWVASDEPLLVALDDLQWGDAYTLGLLTMLCERARAGGRARLLVGISVRDEPNAPPELRALLASAGAQSSGPVSAIALGPLSVADAEQLARSVGPLSPEVLQAVVRGSGQVPFFLMHALGAFRDAGAIVARQGVFCAAEEGSLSNGVPGVSDWLQARLSAAMDLESARGRGSLRALSAVALYGGGLGADVLGEVCGDAAELDSALEMLVDMHVLVVSKGWQSIGFAQEMVRQAALNHARTRRWFVRLHRALLDAVARRPEGRADAAFLAEGYEKIGALEPACQWLGRALENATAAGLFDEAVEWGDRLAALASSPPARVAAQLDTARALLLARRFEEAKERLAGVEAFAGSRGALVGPALDLRRRIARLSAARGLHEAHATDEALLPDADRHGDLGLRCEARMALAGVRGGDAAVGIASEAVELAAGADPAIEYAARVGRAELIYVSDRRDLDMAHADLRRALGIAQASGSRFHRLQIESDLAVIEADRGHLGAAALRLTRLLDETAAQGMRGERRRLLQNRAVFRLRDGRAAEAAEDAAEAARLAKEAGDPGLWAIAGSTRADALRRAGNLPEALLHIEEVERLQRERGDRLRAVSLLRRAEILNALGRVEEAMSDAVAARNLAGERWIAVAAALWVALHAAERGEAAAADVERAVEEASAPDVAPRALVRSLLERANAFLRGDGAATSR